VLIIAFHHHRHSLSHSETCTYGDSSIYMCELHYKATSDADKMSSNMFIISKTQ